ncbi:dehydrogenase [Desulfosarcina ovata subsp. sediminis]|uniref:Dehydrogenase n=1 Tax=Desulfosarcina ovata subsp. sediminis TaxID=885957 RepID=A0A5K7ZLJ4_9BACT|nr:PQQ-binding-like beta-propeller repeat protein [Desulfosarcina ovata]BBO81946.1 dehydrogenase [Desulfosarcina ovata subsp. sediminis]
MQSFKICVTAIIAVLIFSGCAQKGNQGDENLKIDSVVFTRTGLFLKMSEPVSIQKVVLSKDGRILVTHSPGTAGQALIDLAWCNNTKYDLEVVTDKASLAMPVYAPEKPSPVKIAEIPLEDLEKKEMEYLYYAWRGAQVRFSPDGAFIGVGSKGGYVYLVRVSSKKIVWKHKIPEGRVSKVAFTNDGKLIAAEESRDGNVYCFDVNSGDLLWTYRSANDFDMQGFHPKTMGDRFTNYPLVCWGLCVDAKSNVYVMIRHNLEKTVNGRRKSMTTALVCRLNTQNGEPVWRFPINTSAWGLILSRDGRFVFAEIGFAKEAVLSVLDTRSGTPLWQYTFTSPAKGPRSRWGTGFNGAISPDGRYVAINQTYPSTTFLFDNTKSIESGRPELLWKNQFLKTLDVGGIPIGTSSINIELTDTELIFSTYRAQATGRSTSPTAVPAMHPDADTLFVYDFNGNLKWKWKIGDGTWNSEGIISTDGRYIVLPIGVVPSNALADPEGMGVYVFELSRPGGASAKLDWFHHTEGFAYKGDISPDGKTIVVLEGPFDVDPDPLKEDIRGKHRLIILS